ncbi:beta carbonic anhydrase 5, chloroplastic isoform X3 [Vitis vinifera]|uniref:beta carbonic anhydrase 5, chloroplastic isoform X3 n=1 Tax=Vitis vinifera TaxID=29760 RepID=UPI00023B1E90|nr:beta carbonic anhydrase 5, chloroplastic isoform X3 [Vitis vinifera]|eukprot:XP_002263870.2 PREDICTED: beta carbonic anhydrase 5, chloroplastic isoform X4 [Vitis vinifera]
MAFSSSSLSPFPSISSIDQPTRPSTTRSTIFGSKPKLSVIEQTHVTNLASLNQSLRLKASRESPGLTQELTSDRLESIAEIENRYDVFDEVKHRFLSFKKHKYLENLECFQNLATAQAPKFMVIACADSRVCPSKILGFEPGEAFMVRNVANLVPLYENGPTETNAALEFAVNTLEVENILVIGHSCCGGIRALMGMEEEVDSSSFIQSWVVVGKNAKLRAKATASKLSFDQQCRNCEKESINCSLLNLLTYPWIKERVERGMLSIHGGYYDFVNCTFEKWTLDYKESGRYLVKDRVFWA